MDSPPAWILCRRTVLNQANKLATPDLLVNLDHQVEELTADFKSTICDAENVSWIILNNEAYYVFKKSQLLLGPAGSGKSVAIRKVIQNLREELGSNSFRVVELYGIMYEDNNAILASLSSQLETELITSWEAAVEVIKASPLPLIVILDPLETFAEQSRPVVIYTLVDGCMHHMSKGLLVLAVSRRINALDSLERRARSRFTQGAVVFCGLTEISQFIDVIKGILKLKPDFPDKTYSKKWEASVTKLLADNRLKDIISKVTEDDSNVQKIQKLITIAMFSLTEDKQFMDINCLEQAATAMCRDARADVIKSLPEEALGLLVATKHLTENSKSVGPTTLKIGDIIEHYHKFIVHSLNHQISKGDQATINEHYIDTIRILVRLGLLHLHGHAAVMHPFSIVSTYYDTAYLTAVIESMPDEGHITLKKWATGWIE